MLPISMKFCLYVAPSEVWKCWKFQLLKLFPCWDIEVTIEGGGSRIKNDSNQIKTHALSILPFVNDNVLSPEILWIYTTVCTLHTGTLKVILRRVKQFRGISIAYERLKSSRFGTKYHCPSAISSKFQKFGFLILAQTKTSYIIYMTHSA